MQRFWLPGFELQLLRQLQRQQNSAEFCDTVLQTEGISVPTHSCVLAALSPYLSQKLSASPSPPSGQKRQVQLHTVKAQTLLKLVSLLYSGQLEVKGGVEQNDVLAAARQFGIQDLADGHNHGSTKMGELCEGSCGGNKEIYTDEGSERAEIRKRDAQVQAEMATASSLDKRSCVSTGTQTVKAAEEAVDNSFVLSNQDKIPPTAPSVAQSCDVSLSFQPQNIAPDTHFSSTTSPPITTVSGAHSNFESTLRRSSNSVTKPTSTSVSSCDMITLHLSPSDDSFSLSPQEGSVHQHSPEDGIRVMLSEGSTGVETHQPGANREERRRLSANAAMKNLAKMQEVMETAQISIKVKLRRRTKELWEVVSLRDADETLSVVTSLRQDGSHLRRPQRDLINIRPPPSTAHIHKPETSALQAAATSSPKAPPLTNTTTSDCQPIYSASFTLDHNDGLVLAPLQPPGEETDEQIEKLLEDIMMGLNILPSVDRDRGQSRHLDGASATIDCEVPSGEAERGTVNAADYVCYQGYGTQSSHSSSADTGVLCCVAAQSRHGCTGLPSGEPDVADAVQQSSPLYHQSSVRSTKRREGCQDLPLPCPETPSTRSAMPSASFPNFPACQELSSQEDPTVLEFLPLSDGHEVSYQQSFSIGDFQLPRCLSPLEPVFSNTISCGNKGMPQPDFSLQGRPWLMENPRLLQFPLCTVTQRDNTCPPSQQDSNNRCQKEQWQMEWNPHNRRNSVESCTENVVKVKKRSTGGQNAKRRRVSKILKCQTYGTAGDDVAPTVKKKKSKTLQQDDTRSLMVYKDVKASDGTERQINLAVCSVSLSSNNVLAKEREQIVSSLKTPPNCVGKPNQQLTVTRSKNAGGKLGSTKRARIKTKGGLKKAEETPTNTTPENSALKPVSPGDGILKKDGVSLPKRKRGRPAKTPMKDFTSPDSAAPIADKNGHGGESEQQREHTYTTVEETQTKNEERKRRKRRRNGSAEEEVVGMKHIKHAKHPEVIEADDNNNINPAERGSETSKQPRMVSLKEFQQLIKQQHFKARRSKENQLKERNESVRNTEGEGRACGSTHEEPTKETEMDKDGHPQAMDVSEASQVLLDETADENHNQLFNRSSDDNSRSLLDDGSSSSSEKTGSGSNEDHHKVSFAVLEEEADKLAVERQQPPEAPHEEVTVSAGALDETEITVDDGCSSPSDAPLPKGDKMAATVSLNPGQTPERRDPSACGAGRSSDCNQEDEEDVDVLLFSPEKVPQSTECKVKNMGVSPEEEDEEDATDIDVTGDETE